MIKYDINHSLRLNRFNLLYVARKSSNYLGSIKISDFILG